MSVFSVKTVKIRWRLGAPLLDPPCFWWLGLRPPSNTLPLLLNRGATLIAYMSMIKERFEGIKINFDLPSKNWGITTYFDIFS